MRVILSDRACEGVEESTEESKRFVASSAHPDLWGPFDSLGGTRSLRVTSFWCARLARRRIVDEHVGMIGPNAGEQASLGASPGRGRPRHTEAAESVSF